MSTRVPELFPDLASVHQFRATFRENVEIVLDLLDAMRSETAMIGNADAALFLTGVADTLRAYANSTLKSPVVPPSFDFSEGGQFG